MKNFRLITRISLMLAISAVLIFSGCATTQEPGAIEVEKVTRTATVVNVDSAKRIITLKNEEGNTQSYVLGDNVKNFDQIKVGDIVKSSVIESVAVFVRKSGELPDASVTKTVSVAPKGEKPGVVMTDTFEMAARVSAIDLNKGTITIDSADGSTKTFPIDKTEKAFKNVNPGDDVVLNITVAMVIDFEAPAPAGPPAIN